MAGQRQPTNLIVHKGKKHLSKSELEDRRNSEIVAPANAIAPPSYLTKIQKAKFDLISQQLLNIGIMANLDCDALARYIQSETKYQRYDKLVSSALRKASSYDKASEMLGELEKLENLRDKALKQCRSAASDFGLTISSRCKLIVPKKEKRQDPHASLFGDEDTG